MSEVMMGALGIQVESLGRQLVDVTAQNAELTEENSRVRALLTEFDQRHAADQAELEALRRAPVSAGKVKALVWEPVLCGTERAHAVGLCYEVAQRAGREEWFWWLQHLPHRKSASFSSVEAAKAAAQADYEARILSALQPGDGWQGIEALIARMDSAAIFVDGDDCAGGNLWRELKAALSPASLPQGEETR